MSAYARRHLPHAVYLDTNVLRAAGGNLNKPWMVELLSFARQYQIKLCISDLVLDEWCAYIQDNLKKKKQAILSAKDYLGQYDVGLPDINDTNIVLPDKAQLRKIIGDRLVSVGFDIVPNWEPSVPDVLEEAVSKMPPFEDGGKGFCDAVILESYVLHAVSIGIGPDVIVISKDGAVCRSQQRFARAGLGVTFVGQSEINGKLTSLLDAEVKAMSDERQRKLNEFVFTHEQSILEFVNKSSLVITEWLLKGIFGLPDDEKVEGTIKNILAVRPTKVQQVIGGAPRYGEEVQTDRYPLQIFVNLEIELEVHQYDYFYALSLPRAVAIPEQLETSPPLQLSESPPVTIRPVRQTVNRTVSVSATIDAASEKEGCFRDLVLESVH